MARSNPSLLSQSRTGMDSKSCYIQRDYTCQSHIGVSESSHSSLLSAVYNIITFECSRTRWHFLTCDDCLWIRENDLLAFGWSTSPLVAGSQTAADWFCCLCVLNVGKVKIFMTYYVPHVSSISLIDHVNCVCHIVYVFNRQIYCVNIVSSRVKHFCHLRIFFLKRSISNREIKIRFLHTNGSYSDEIN